MGQFNYVSCVCFHINLTLPCGMLLNVFDFEKRMTCKCWYCHYYSLPFTSVYKTHFFPQMFVSTQGASYSYWNSSSLKMSSNLVLCNCISPCHCCFECSMFYVRLLIKQLDFPTVSVDGEKIEDYFVINAYIFIMLWREMGGFWIS